METMPERINTILDECVESIRSAMQSQGINASGRTSEGFRVEERDGHYLLLLDRSNGAAPLTTLEFGREPGKVPQTFTEIIEQWSRDKGIQFTTEKERHKFAGAVAWGKIRKEGFGRPSPSTFGSFSETVYTEAVEEARQRLWAELPGLMARYFKNETGLGWQGKPD